jgi:hypothetical protein
MLPQVKDDRGFNAHNFQEMRAQLEQNKEQAVEKAEKAAAKAAGEERPQQRVCMC